MERPDGLVIWDDNLVDSALSGIVAAGVRVPDEVSVCAAAAAGGPAFQGLPLSCCRFDS